jgi:xylose dehydrogenase (NAD/NADP)
MTCPVLRWGILGTGHIATRFATQLAGLGGRARLQAVGAREPAKAAAFAAEHGAERSGSYADVLADPAVEAVYISLLNRDHATWSIAASRAGKRVLCEKPAALTAAELTTMLDAARAAGTFWMEAFAYRCHPRWRALRRLLPDLGGPLTAHACFSFHAPDKPRLLDPLGGGSLMDVGCYPLSWLITLLGAPEELHCTARRAATGVDLAASVSLRFAAGHVASAVCGCDAAIPQLASIAGPAGAIEIAEPFRNQAGAAFRLHAGGTASDIAWDDDGIELYAREALGVAEYGDCLEHPEMSWADSLTLARTIDTCREQAGVRWS